MYICVCKGITDHQIKDAVYAGAQSVGQLRKQLGVASQCGKCLCAARDVIEETRGNSAVDYRSPLPQYYAVA